MNLLQRYHLKVTTFRNGNELFKADGRYYLFQDSTVNASFYILQLYNALIKGTVNSLYDKITNGKIEPSKPLIKNTDISKMKAHVGQMGGAYPLSPSQREAMNHFGEIKEGNLLAVSGASGNRKDYFFAVCSGRHVCKICIEEGKGTDYCCSIH